MAKNLVIVESPAKAKTIRKYLGNRYAVKASVGHVRDLPTRDLGVDIENGFRPTYVIPDAKLGIVKELREAAATSEAVYLATDPDREGEAIAWHVAESIGLPAARTRRVSFDQVTKAAVTRAMTEPRELDNNLVDAQQARRVLDRLVGYKISPLLTRAITKDFRNALSAGRVQSVALRLVVEREREIMGFVPEEYWTLEADLARVDESDIFRAKLHRVSGEKPSLGSKEQMDALIASLEGASWAVEAVRKGKRHRKPRPPFVTSTLQAAASSKLHMSPRRTMRLAQQLYEGIEIEGEAVGLITYMRTDATHVAPEAQREAQAYIDRTWGNDYRPSRPPTYRSKVANAQEAHEAIRPTSVERTPKAMAKHLTKAQARLYELIWRRFVASQMNPAVYATTSVDIRAGEECLFRATGSSLLFAGYTIVYADARDRKNAQEQSLPKLSKGDTLDLKKLLPEQHFTQPAPRYNETSLIRALEEHGVGRPSTYASIIGVIQDRDYVVKEGRQLKPTDMGFVVCDALVATFPDIMDIAYTASMEERLDGIARGEVAYGEMLGSFYEAFEPQLVAAEQQMPEAVSEALKAGLPDELRDRTCPRCGKPLAVRVSKAGRFLGCTGFPECRYVLDLSNPEEPKEPKEVYAEGEICEVCGGRMKIVEWRGRRFLGCENYPECKHTRPILSERIKELAQTTPCPQCGTQPMEPRSGRYGEYLYCPTCDKNWSLRKLGAAKKDAKPVDIPCPACGQTEMEYRQGRYGPYYHCKACGKNHAASKIEANEG
ncbi:MAG: type I DNA topoisomerase [Anaerolineae bacterium]